MIEEFKLKATKIEAHKTKNINISSLAYRPMYRLRGERDRETRKGAK